MTTEYEDILAAIKARLEAIPNIGRVHDYERWANDPQVVKELYVADIGGQRRLRGWNISCPRLPQNTRKLTGVVHERIYDFVIRGFWELDDASASEKQARAKADEIIDSFDSKPDLSGECFKTELALITSFEPGMFAGTLVHMTEILLKVHDRVTVTYT